MQHFILKHQSLPLTTDKPPFGGCYTDLPQISEILKMEILEPQKLNFSILLVIKGLTKAAGCLPFR